MKVAALLAQYLYKYKELDLPGLGTFRLDPSVVVDTDGNKQSKPIQLDGVSFESNPATRESPELIQFISTHAGKIKALASADLESHLGLATQFLNIGKPFLFEGIGTLTRIRSREYEFTPAFVIPSTLRESPVRENISREVENDGDYKSVLYTAPASKSSWKKPAIVALLVGGLGLALWGGYTVYKRTNSKNKAAETSSVEVITDSNKYVNKQPNDTANQSITKNTPDTARNSQNIPSTATISGVKPPAGTYKFIFEVTNKARAISRLKTLQSYRWNAFMETADSVNFKIYVLHAASPVDTAHLVDSFSKFNGKRVYIE